MLTTEHIAYLLKLIKQTRAAQQWYDKYHGYQSKQRKRQLEKKLDALLLKFDKETAIQLTINDKP